MTALDIGMLLLDPERPIVYTVTSKSTIVAHHGSCSEKATLRKPGVLPEGWKIIVNRTLARELVERMTDRTQAALAVTRRLNGGAIPTEALTAEGFDPEEVFSEDSSVFGLNDPDNNIIDFGWQGNELLVIHCERNNWELQRTQKLS